MLLVAIHVSGFKVVSVRSVPKMRVVIDHLLVSCYLYPFLVIPGAT